MIHKDHVNLIKKAVNLLGGKWADFGSGDGAFTLALRDIAGPKVEMFSVDKDKYRLKNQERNFNNQFVDSNIHFIDSDFTKPLNLPLLDGIIMANSLHFIKDKEPVLELLKSYLKQKGKFVLIEYNDDMGNMWVPYPLSFKSFEKLTEESGFESPKLIGAVESDFMREIYSALTYKL